MLKIQKSFDTSREIVKSLQDKAKVTLTVRTRGNNYQTGTAKEQVWRNTEITAKWQMEYKVYLGKQEKYNNN